MYGGGTTEGKLALNYFEQWGFYASLYELANEDYFKLQELLKEDIHKIHVHLSIKNDTNKLKAELSKPKK